MENPDERAQESWKLREKTLPRRGASRDAAAVPLFLVPYTLPPKKESHQEGKKGGRFPQAAPRGLMWRHKAGPQLPAGSLS